MENLEQKAGGKGLFSRARAAAEHIRKSAMKPVLYGALATTLLASACADGSNVSSSSNNTGNSSNHYPIESLEVSPTSGNAPLDVNIKLNCSDEDGNMHIYGVITPQGTLQQVVPIDITETFMDNGAVEGYCIDTTGLRSSTTVSVGVNHSGNNSLEIDFSGTNVDITEAENGTQRTKTVYLPNTDMDGNPLNYTDARTSNPNIALDAPYYESGSWKVDIIADDAVTEETQYTAEFDAENDKGESGTKTLEGTLENLFEMEGNLHDNESDTAVSSGVIKSYEIPGGAPVESGNSYVSSNGSGEFYVESTSPVNEVLVQFAEGSGANNLLSYVRSRKFDGSKDIQGETVKVVPLPSSQGLDVNGDSYVNSQDDADFKNHYTSMQFPLTKWDLSSPPKVQIVRDNDCDGSSNFGQGQIDVIKNVVDNLSSYLGGTSLQKNVYPDDGGTKQYECNSDNEINPLEGIVIAPVDILGAGLTRAKDNNGDGLLDTASVKIRHDYTGNDLDILVDHELITHGGIISPGNGHPNILPDYMTNTNDAYTGDGIPEEVDIFAGEITNELTYEPGEGGIGWINPDNTQDSVHSILGLDFYN